jgi:hypothetical protein
VPSKRSGRAISQFLFVFACVFGGLALPSPRVARLYVQAHADLGNVLLKDAKFERGVQLDFDSSFGQSARPWQLTLRIRDPARTDLVLVPIDLRTLLFLPLITFVGLCSAVRLGTVWLNVRLLVLGLMILQPVLWLLTALPVISFLGGTGPVRALHLSRVVHVVLQVLYRATVVPPGMAYALPLLLWWALLPRTPAVVALGSTEPAAG